MNARDYQKAKEVAQELIDHEPVHDPVDVHLARVHLDLMNKLEGMVLVPEEELERIFDIVDKGNMQNPYDMAQMLRNMIAKAKVVMEVK